MCKNIENWLDGFKPLLFLNPNKPFYRTGGALPFLHRIRDSIKLSSRTSALSWWASQMSRLSCSSPQPSIMALMSRDQWDARRTKISLHTTWRMASCWQRSNRANCSLAFAWRRHVTRIWARIWKCSAWEWGVGDGAAWDGGACLRPVR